MSTEQPSTLNLAELAKHFSDEGKAYELVESIRWPNGPICPHCAVVGEAKYLAPRGEGRKTRSGKVSARRVWKCMNCKRQFSVTVGTIFERSHVPLNKWLLAIHLMTSGKNGVSAHELHRDLGVTYKTAWFVAHRIRYAMQREPIASKLTGTVEADETYIGGRGRGSKGGPYAGGNKIPVVTVVERETGIARSRVVPHVTAANVAQVVREEVSRPAKLMTDTANFYTPIGREYMSHETVNHSRKEYVRGNVYTNTVEGFFSQMKRSLDGTYHHVSREHLHRYLCEFDLRYSTRKMPDGERTRMVIQNSAGKRLTYYDPLARLGRN